MFTSIHVSKKMEKSIKKSMTFTDNVEHGPLGKWNATLFYMDRKKCWLISNATTQYVFVLTGINSEKVKYITELFRNTLYTQLCYDGILIDSETIERLIGEIRFLPTDNDKRTTGFQNRRIYELSLWKEQYGFLVDMPIKELTHRMNNSLLHLTKTKRYSDYTDAAKEMKKLLLDYL